MAWNPRVRFEEKCVAMGAGEFEEHCFLENWAKESPALSPKCNTCVTASVPFCYTFEVVFNFKILIVNNLFFLARFLFEEISGCGVGLNK